MSDAGRGPGFSGVRFQGLCLFFGFRALRLEIQKLLRCRVAMCVLGHFSKTGPTKFKLAIIQQMYNAKRFKI